MLKTTKTIKFYSYIKHKQNENCGIAPIKSDGITYTDATQKANILNKQFESVFSKPKPMNLRHQAEINLIKSGKHPTTSSKMDNINITLPGVEKLLKDLNSNKASGPDEISPRLMKELHHEIAP